jgi:hypothetical protein
MSSGGDCTVQRRTCAPRGANGDDANSGRSAHATLNPTTASAKQRALEVLCLTPPPAAWAAAIACRRGSCAAGGVCSWERAWPAGAWPGVPKPPPASGRDPIEAPRAPSARSPACAPRGLRPLRSLAPSRRRAGARRRAPRSSRRGSSAPSRRKELADSRDRGSRSLASGRGVWSVGGPASLDRHAVVAGDKVRVRDEHVLMEGGAPFVTHPARP